MASPVESECSSSSRIWIILLLVNTYQCVLTVAKPYHLGMLNGVDAMLLVDAVEQICGVVGGRHLLIVDDVDAGLVKGYGVGRSEDAVVFEFHGLGMVHAVAVYRHIVHHRDIDDALLFLEVVHHSLCCSRHRLEEAVLIADVLRRPELTHVELLHLSC